VGDTDDVLVPDTLLVAVSLTELVTLTLGVSDCSGREGKGRRGARRRNDVGDIASEPQPGEAKPHSGPKARPAAHTLATGQTIRKARHQARGCQHKHQKPRLALRTIDDDGDTVAVAVADVEGDAVALALSLLDGLLLAVTLTLAVSLTELVTLTLGVSDCKECTG
jgi:hypothetical protein